jgi:mono/diheme cytochrome c family protein
MFKPYRSLGSTSLLMLTAVGLVTIGTSLSICQPSLADPFVTQDPGGQDPGIPDGQVPGDDEGMPLRNTRSKASKKKSARKADTASKSKRSTGKATAASDGKIQFSKDIAPVLVANCINCHSKDNVGLRRGKLDLTTFENLKKGSLKRPDDPLIVVPGKPDESHLILRIKGEEEPRMPQGGQNRMSDAAIATFEQWVKEGAQLDAGLDPKKPIQSYAATPEQLVRSQTAKLPPGERDKKVEAVGRERWKQANPKLKPEVASSEHFMMFSTSPSDRAGNTNKAMETQFGHLKRMLGSPTTDWVEKVSLYVFSSRNDFIEFVRSVESREIEQDMVWSAKLSIAQPYLAVLDPAGGHKEEPSGARRKGRSRRGAEPDAGGGAEVDRSLAGLLAEALGTGTLAATGRTPRWLAEGFGSYMASQVEPRSQYYHQLRQTAFANFDQGWRTKANEAMGGGDQTTAEAVHAVGFALVEAMMSGMRQGFPDFLKGMSQGSEKLDDVLQLVYGGTREEFLDGTGEWVASHYGRLQ